MKRFTLLIASAALAVAGSAFAQGLGPQAAADLNGDGKVDKAEYIAGAKAMLDRYDLDKDGRITLSEQAAMGGDGAIQRALIAKHGEDYSAITLAALQADREVRFGQVDTDKDGFISREELRESLRPVRDILADRKLDKAESLAQAKVMFERLDTDNDGKVGGLTLAETQARAAARFDRNDTNKDGFLTADETKAATLAAIDAPRGQ